MLRLSAAARPTVFGLSMAFLDERLMSDIETFRAFGVDWSKKLWLRSWGRAFRIAAPAGLSLRPLAEAIAQAAR